MHQANQTFEAFNIHNIEIGKCVIDISTYTRLIRAQIIYNHIFYSNLPVEVLLNLVSNSNYLKLVNHKNFSPRIIEATLKRKIWEHCPPDEFTDVFKAFFDNPESVWLYAFENTIDTFTQFTLLVLASFEVPVLMEDLEKGLMKFLSIGNQKYFLGYDSIKFSRAIYELQDTFIKTDKDSSNQVIIDYQNPSILDFLVNYLKGVYSGAY